MTKILYVIWTLACVAVSFICLSYAVDSVTFPYKDNNTSSNVQQWSIKDQVKLAVTDTQWPIQKFIKLFLPNRPTGEWVFAYIQYIINIALSLVAFIALIVLIYGFYGILFRDSQEWITNAKKTVRWTMIAIVVMGASWLIVQVLFYIITKL